MFHDVHSKSFSDASLSNLMAILFPVDSEDVDDSTYAFQGHQGKLVHKKNEACNAFVVPICRVVLYLHAIWCNDFQFITTFLGLPGKFG